MSTTRKRPKRTRCIRGRAHYWIVEPATEVLASGDLALFPNGRKTIKGQCRWCRRRKLFRPYRAERHL